ncbi:hypothetical protein [Rhizomicrobium electricum]|uniref:Uncharacterized protein n=1 Tax=Rhizomicrobium electricum TaxID=480070 RepID=A0ABP3P9F4_9PROT|nr:hypothetical protein [Rhizomicrobium electricum]NIJ47938.1 hypothetical protein [Rhizomicrobium electricum]
MLSRTSSKQVTFFRSFRLSGFDHVQPPGVYRIDTLEELIEAVSFSAWKRVSTTMPLTYNGLTEYMPVDPGELDRALANDAAPRTDPPSP